MGEGEFEVKDPVENANIKEVDELVPILVKAWKQHQDEEGWANFSAAGSFVKRANPDFDPRSYGVTKMVEILERLSKYFDTKRVKGKGTTNLVLFKLKKKF